MRTILLQPGEWVREGVGGCMGESVSECGEGEGGWMRGYVDLLLTLVSRRWNH